MFPGKKWCRRDRGCDFFSLYGFGSFGSSGGSSRALIRWAVIQIVILIIWAILLRVTEYYSITLHELTVSGGCTDVLEAVELMLSVLFNESSSLVQFFFVIFLSERDV